MILPSNWLDFDNSVIWYSMIDKKFYCPEVWVTNFNKLLLNSKCRFIFQYFYLVFPDQAHHASFLIIDKKTKTIQRFDPHGMPEKFYYKDYLVLDEKITEYFLSEGIIESLLSPVDYCTIGPQWKQEKEERKRIKEQKNLLSEIETVIGYCAAWSIWYTDVRLSYPDMNPKELDQKINEWFDTSGTTRSKIIFNFGQMLMSHAKRIVGKKLYERDPWKFMLILSKADTIR